MQLNLKKKDSSALNCCDLVFKHLTVESTYTDLNESLSSSEPSRSVM